MTKIYSEQTWISGLLPLKLIQQIVLLLCWLLLLTIHEKSYGQDSDQAGTLSIRGRIYDTHEPPVTIPGASITIKGTGKGTLTDVDGYFSIKAKKNDVLVISMVSFKSIEYTVTKSDNALNLSLRDDVSDLNEVVVVGITKMQKNHIASSVASLDIKSNVNNKPITALSQALQGGVTGIQVSQGSGLPGADAANIKIRGTTSLNNTNPLILIDGIPGDMNYLDPATVESITVLKDAAAAAMYGARGANGVIVVVTKRGIADKVNIAYDGYGGAQTAAYLPTLVDAPTYMTMYNEALVNQGSNKPPQYTPEQIDKTRSGIDPIAFPNTNWLDLMIRKYNPILSHTLSVNGGNNVSRFALSANYIHQGGMIPNTESNNYQIRANTSTTLSKSFVVNLDMFLLKKNSEQANRPNDASISGNRILQDIYRTPPDILPVYPQKDGVPTSYGRYVDIVNPYAVGKIGGQRSFESNLASINLQPKWEVFSNFNLRGQFSYKLSTDIGKTVRDNYNFFDYYTGQLVQTWDAQRVAGTPVRASYYYLGANGDYTFDLGQHHFYAMVGYAQEENNTGNFDASSLLSGYAKLNYSYKDTYLLEGSVRADGSSKFGPGHKVGYFPAVAIGWNVQNESFMKNIKAITNLKIRGSYGKLGNENIGLYQYQSTISNDNGTESIYGNPDITWESVTMLDLGMDVSISRFSFTFDYYNKITDNIILYPPLPLSGGFLDAVPVNAGKVRNRGWEFSFNYGAKLGKDFALSVKPGITYNENKLLSLKGGPYISGTRINEVGGSIGSYYGYQTDGLLQAGDFDSNGNPLLPIIQGEKPGDIKYVDFDGDGIITAKDQKRIGSPVPKLDYFANINLNYKHFNLDFLLQGAGESEVPLMGMLAYPLDIAGGGGTPSTYYAANYWQKDRVDARFPRINTAPELNKESSDFWFQNASYLRVKYIQLAYDLNGAFIKRLGLSSVRLYLNGQNPFTFSSMKLTDPESRGTEWTYGIQKTYTFGLNVRL